MDWDLSGFGLILQVFVQVVMSFRWRCRILAVITGFLWLVHTAVCNRKISAVYNVEKGGKDGALSPCLKSDWAGLGVLDFDVAGTI
jgi:hypothetical protein